MNALHARIVQIFRYIGVALGIAVVAGCVQKTFVEDHSGRDLVTLSAGLVQGDADSGAGDRAIAFISVDGKALTSRWLLGAPSELKLTPGVHVIRVIYRHRTFTIDQTLEANFSPGSNYQLHEGSENGAPHLWLTIAGTDKRVKMDQVVGAN